MDNSTKISIHALREEGDLVGSYHCETHDISIHALREEGDLQTQTAARLGDKFLSTPSARRATAAAARLLSSVS